MTESSVDVLLVGGGIMSATLGMLLNQLDPTLTIVMAERLEEAGRECSDGWNNAGTGHAGYCELNYTPVDAFGRVEIFRALSINAAFEVSLQFWSSLVERDLLPAPTSFIHRTPHLSFVWGERDVAFLRERHARLSAHPLFRDMEYSENATTLADWMPLVMAGRTGPGPVAATRVVYGTDVDFGSLTRSLVKSLQRQPNFELKLGHTVQSLTQKPNGRWQVELRETRRMTRHTIEASFVFLGAGGATLPLLQASAIPEGRGYGGFPVSGQWLICRHPHIVSRHHAKVYGKAPLGAPPMSVPHLDTRIIDGQPALLFGPFAGFTTRFAKRGSPLDLLASVRSDNLISMLSAGVHHLDLTCYLVGEAFKSHAERMASLKAFYPEAREEDWSLGIAGQRVQIIKQGKLEFGTEIVAARDGSLAALLGASPGASVSAQAMIEVIERCFRRRLQQDGWQTRLKALVPSYGESLIERAYLLERIRPRTLEALGLV
ncbi:MAG: malate dehydrogenase (quinone) [Methylophilaceae bacterium]|nr:malate dehydrogenase (quinone) [Methylophilaceae bacterium]